MTLIILPVHNESKTIQESLMTLLNWCQKNMPQAQIMFIDDWSTDDTFKKVSELKKPKVKCVRNQFDPGKGSALKTAYLMSDWIYKMDENDLIVFMDGDGQINPQEIRTFLNLMDTYDADVVIGNKRHLYSSISYNVIRKVVSSCYNALIRFLFDIGYQDTQCGIKIFRKYALDKVIHKVSVKRFAFDLELIVALRAMGMRVVDAPVKVTKQLNAGSVNYVNIKQTFKDTIEIWKKRNRGFYNG